MAGNGRSDTAVLRKKRLNFQEIFETQQPIASMEPYSQPIQIQTLHMQKTELTTPDDKSKWNTRLACFPRPSHQFQFRPHLSVNFRCRYLAYVIRTLFRVQGRGIQLPVSGALDWWCFTQTTQPLLSGYSVDISTGFGSEVCRMQQHRA